MYTKLFVLLLVNLKQINSKPFSDKLLSSAPCQACHPIDPERINVHLVPHSHDDVGWLKTVDQYYYGTQRYIQDAGVQYIISSSIDALKGHPDRRYIQVESAFFWKWWQNQEEEQKQQVKQLVNNGQLEIVNGAWSMNDEAAAHYHSIIDQFTWGLRFLNDTFGACGRPKVGWQIDPFGHSREHASVLSQLGFEGLVIGRLDFRDKVKRKIEKNLDFLWRSSANLNNSELFTTIFPEFYLSVDGFCFDITCNDGYINDDEKSPDYNLKSKVKDFAQHMNYYKSYYQTPNFLVPMGGDFNYQAAEINFSNMDKLIKGFEGHQTYNVFYSTPSCYIKAVNEDLNKKSLTLKTKTDDFFPYANEKHGFWTGYFTSRPTSKRFERLGNNILQAAKQLNTFSRVNGADEENSINYLREVMGILQHHDAITGTEKQAVANDYARMLTEAIREAEAPVGRIVGNILKKDNQSDIDLQLETCLLVNVSICEATKKNSFVVVVYNPLSRNVSHFVRLPVDDGNLIITGPDGQEEYDVFPTMSAFDYVQEKLKPSRKEVVFEASNVPPLGLKLFLIEQNQKEQKFEDFREVEEGEFFGSKDNGFTIDAATGRLSSVTLKGLTLKAKQDFLSYVGSTGSGGRASGAYVFRPKVQSAEAVNDKKVDVKVKKGKLVDEVLQVFNSEITQIIRVYKGTPYIEFDWLVGNLQMDYSGGREIITRFTFEDFENKGIFYTDSNGREQIKRELNKRSDFEYDASEEPTSGNYYPITSKIVIKDEKKNLEIAVLNDRAQGGSSLKDGVIELMVHRKLVRDDGFGVNEALQEEQYKTGLYARGQHFLTFGAIRSSWENERSSAAVERDLAHRKLLSPLVLLSNTQDDALSFEKLNESFSFEFSGLSTSLPENVQILTLEPWRDDTYLLRLEHTLEVDEDRDLSKTVTISLENLFTGFFITEIGETTLGANQWLDDYEFEEKLSWNNISRTAARSLDMNDPLKIDLGPMQIRTFIIKVEKKDE